MEEPLGLDVLALLEAVHVVGGLDAVERGVARRDHLGHHLLALDLGDPLARVAAVLLAKDALADRRGVELVALVHHAQRLELVVGADLLVNVAAEQLHQVLLALPGEVRDARARVVAALEPGERLLEEWVEGLDVGRHVPDFILKGLVLALLGRELLASDLLLGAQGGDVLGGQEGGLMAQVERVGGKGDVVGQVGDLGDFVVDVATDADAVLLVSLPVAALAVVAAVAGELAAAAEEELHHGLAGGGRVSGLLVADDAARRRLDGGKGRHGDELLVGNALSGL